MAYWALESSGFLYKNKVLKSILVNDINIIKYDLYDYTITISSNLKSLSATVTNCLF